MSSVVADTHAILWFLLGSPRLSATARDAMLNAVSSGEPIHVSSITLVEATYLVEKNRIHGSQLELLFLKLDNPHSSLAISPVTIGVVKALARVSSRDVPDMPDRIIAATALHLGLPLVARDRKIRSASIETIW